MPKTIFLALQPEDILSLIMGVLAVAALMVLSYFALRWLQKRGYPGVESKHMKVIERVALNRESAILIVQIGLRLIAVSQGKDGLHFLCELSPGDFPEEMPKETAGGGKDGFASRFLHNLKVNARLAPGGTPLRRPAAKEDDGALEGDVSFGEVFRQISEREAVKNPMSGGKSASESGYMPVRRRDNPSRGGNPIRNSYQDNIRHLKSLSQPDALDSKARGFPPTPYEMSVSRRDGYEKTVPPPEDDTGTLTQSAADPADTGMNRDVPTAQSAVKREEKIDELLDRIAERQSRYQKE